ncbi:ESX secretion-associated protein EspG [Nocardia sp. NEAU-G5]|uniref:ESX secretion-associated protein EspG n=1 Tax=Nocardia albiluteola TaxID=2842303 RepID=A0ABS6BEZ4_9NOCA|nr:ESX secretion-associated protein EspG [Nocardia albiluteola]MBU3068005.1 ESX secretion-associated protein EspG [Nocardia albiluteola]
MTVYRGRLTSLELVVLWEMLSDDSLPFPLMHWPEQQYEQDYIRAKRETADRLVGKPPFHAPRGWESVDLMRLWKAAVNPDILIRAAGEAPGDETDMSAVTRVVGLRREGFAVVLVQHPGETIDRGGNVDVYQTDVVGLAKAVIERLPRVERGKHAEIPLPPREPEPMEYSYGASPVLNSSADPTRQRADRWFRAKATQVGELRIEPGSGVHWIQERNGFLVHWRDVADDGRYLIEPKPSPVAVAVDDNAFEIFVNQRIAALVRRIREDRPIDRGFRVS